MPLPSLTPLMVPCHPLGLPVLIPRRVWLAGVGWGGVGVLSSFDLLHFQTEAGVFLTCGLRSQPEPTQDTPQWTMGSPKVQGSQYPIGSKAGCLVSNVRKLWLSEVKGALHDSWWGADMDEQFCPEAFHGTGGICPQDALDKGVIRE